MEEQTEMTKKWVGLTIGLVLVFAVAASDLAGAQQQAASESTAKDKPETVAILPWVYQKGTDGAKKAAKEFLEAVLTKAYFEVIPEARVRLAWAKNFGHDHDELREELPDPKELLKLGRYLGVNWVITGKAVWHTRSLWIGLGPKTKSNCTVDMLIVDVQHAELALDARKVMMDSTAKEDTLKAVGTVFVSALFTTVSGGPKTPHEQRAVQLAIAKAIQPWLSSRPQVRKIDTEEKPAQAK